MTVSVADAMGGSRRPKPVNGNTPWAGRYAAELRQVITSHASRSARTLQKALGPSELGEECHRAVVGKMAGIGRTNHVSDPWPSIVGTAVHAWLEEAFSAENVRQGLTRWLTETRVTPLPLPNSGTGDLYDGAERAVVDWKNLGKTTLDKLRRHGPPRKYRVQLKLYGLGFFHLGLPVERIVIAALPRTESTLDGMYVWEEPWALDDPELAQTFKETGLRTRLAEQVVAGHLDWMTVPAVPSDDGCYFCPYYRPEATDGGSGCPGTKGT